MEDYRGNILDYLQKVWDMTEDYEELIEGLSMTFDSMQTNKTNETIKILTLGVDHHPAFDLHHWPLWHERQATLPGAGLGLLGHHGIHGRCRRGVLYLFQA